MAEEPTEPAAEETPPEAPAEPVTRAKNLYYIGERDAVTGEPIQYVMGVPAKDLNEDEIRLLSDAEYNTALEVGLYRKTKPTAKEGGA
jgi:hypothetical protein